MHVSLGSDLASTNAIGALKVTAAGLNNSAAAVIDGTELRHQTETGTRYIAAGIEVNVATVYTGGKDTRCHEHALAAIAAGAARQDAADVDVTVGPQPDAAAPNGATILHNGAAATKNIGMRIDNDVAKEVGVKRRVVQDHVTGHEGDAAGLKTAVGQSDVVMRCVCTCDHIGVRKRATTEGTVPARVHAEATAEGHVHAGRIDVVVGE